MDAQRDKLNRHWPIKLKTLATVDGQFITLSVYLCIEHDASEAARRTGASTTANHRRF